MKYLEENTSNFFAKCPHVFIARVVKMCMVVEEDFHEIYKCDKCGAEVHITQRDIMWIFCMQCGNKITNGKAWFRDQMGVWIRKLPGV